MQKAWEESEREKGRILNGPGRETDGEGKEKAMVKGREGRPFVKERVLKKKKKKKKTKTKRERAPRQLWRHFADVAGDVA
jgi:hypothetical protein